MKELFYRLIYMLNTLMPKKRASILLYHDVGKSDLYLTVPAKRFEEQMQYLYEKNYNVISLKILCKLLREGNDIPKKTIVLTFDDGYLSHKNVVLDILEKYNFHGTFFVATKFIGNSINNSEQKPQRVLGHEGIQKLEHSPYADVEPHSVTHREFDDLSEDECEKEICTSKKVIDEMLEKDSSLFAYPRGVYSKIHAEMLRKLGFMGAVTVDGGVIKEGDNRYTLKRNTIHSKTSMSLFAVQINSISSLFYFIKRTLLNC